MSDMGKLVLASKSPRRIELLSKYMSEIEVIESGIRENMDPYSDPREATMSLAFQKAIDVALKVPEGDIVIGADTVVFMDMILGKPESKLEAKEMLKMLSGKKHKVVTGIAVINRAEGKKIIDNCVTEVEFRCLTEQMIDAYLSVDEYKDKAGSYAIQGIGDVFVKSIDGSYSNVVGLPICLLDEVLKDHFKTSLL